MEEISNDELLRDLRITRKKTIAYEKIAQGFAALAEIEDANPMTKKENLMQRMKYEQLHKECSEFQDHLIRLAKERKEFNAS